MRRIFSATIMAAYSCSGSSIRNSSPPMRVMVSESRSCSLYCSHQRDKDAVSDRMSLGVVYILEVVLSMRMQERVVRTGFRADQLLYVFIKKQAVVGAGELVV